MKGDILQHIFQAQAAWTLSKYCKIIWITKENYVKSCTSSGHSWERSL